MSSIPEISMFDNVRVRAGAATEALGLVDLVGQVHGQTKPSVTEVNVIGDLQTDYAINVYFDDLGEGYWIVPELLEFVNHAPGTDIGLGNRRWVRKSNGTWEEQLPGENNAPTIQDNDQPSDQGA